MEWILCLFEKKRQTAKVLRRDKSELPNGAVQGRWLCNVLVVTCTKEWLTRLSDTDMYIVVIAPLQQLAAPKTIMQIAEIAAIGIFFVLYSTSFN